MAQTSPSPQAKERKRAQAQMLGLRAQLAEAKAEAAPLRAALEAQGVEVPGSGWHAFGCAQYAGTGNMKCLRRCSLGRAALDALKGVE